jgi:hypothetical protein
LNLKSLTDQQLVGIMRAAGLTPEDSTPLARAHYRDETTLGWPNWPGSENNLVWKPQIAPTPEQRLLLLRACWKLLTGQDLPEMAPLRTAEVTVRFDFEAGYHWPSVELTGRG